MQGMLDETYSLKLSRENITSPLRYFCLVGACKVKIDMALVILLTVKALSSPRGAYLISDLAEGGLIERGAY